MVTTLFDMVTESLVDTKTFKGSLFLIEKKNKKQNEIYIELGFETLPHFYCAFKKQFGLTPTELTEQQRKKAR